MVEVTAYFTAEGGTQLTWQIASDTLDVIWSQCPHSVELLSNQAMVQGSLQWFSVSSDGTATFQLEILSGLGSIRGFSMHAKVIRETFEGTKFDQ